MRRYEIAFRHVDGAYVSCEVHARSIRVAIRLALGYCRHWERCFSRENGYDYINPITDENPWFVRQLVGR